MGGMRFEEFDLSNLGDLLGGMFGGGGRRAASRQPVRGNDLETHVRVSFEDSLKGVLGEVGGEDEEKTQPRGVPTRRVQPPAVPARALRKDFKRVLA